MNAKQFFEKAGRAILDFLFPIFCVGCKREKTHCCRECFGVMSTAEPIIEASNSHFAFEKIVAAAPHKEGSPLAKLIHRFKYDGAQEIGSTLAGFIRKEWGSDLPEDSILVPVPLHKRRKLFRGFNQSEVLAQAISKTLNFRCENLLQRHAYTQPQVELGHDERLKNLKNAFSLANPMSKCSPNATYILVDDVATTGTTLNECAKVLKAAGATKIICLVVCRATTNK